MCKFYILLLIYRMKATGQGYLCDTFIKRIYLEYVSYEECVCLLFNAKSAKNVSTFIKGTCDLDFVKPRHVAS